jgi:hypothetical protein
LFCGTFVFLPAFLNYFLDVRLMVSVRLRLGCKSNHPRYRFKHSAQRIFLASRTIQRHRRPAENILAARTKFTDRAKIFGIKIRSLFIHITPFQVRCCTGYYYRQKDGKNPNKNRTKTDFSEKFFQIAIAAFTKRY